MKQKLSTPKINKHIHGSMQKEKVDADCEKSAQISILASKIATKWRLNAAIKESKLHITFIFHYNFMLLFDRKTRIGVDGSFSFT